MKSNRPFGRIREAVRRLLNPFSTARTSRVLGDDTPWRTMARYISRERLASDAAQIEAWCAANPEHERVRRGLVRIAAVSRDLAVDYQRQAAWEHLARRIEAEDHPLTLSRAYPITDDELRVLLLRHTRGRATPDDAERLRTWIEEDPSRAALVRRAEQVAAASRGTVRKPAAGSREALHARIQRESAHVPAAFSSHSHRFATDARFTAQPLRWRFIAAAAAAVIAVGVVGTRSLGLWDRGVVAEHEYRTGRGERADITLVDGSRITLGAASRLRAPEHFGKRRDVQLEGEAFFRVAHDPDHPFVVHAGNATVQAIGTSFDVRRYAEDTSVRVVVAEGRVALQARDAAAGSGATLARGEVGELNARGTVAYAKRGALLGDYLGWLDGKLVYRLAPLSTVISDLARWYDFDVQVADPRLNDARVTLVLPSANADVVGRLLADVLGARYEHTGRVITLIRAEP